MRAIAVVAVIVIVAFIANYPIRRTVAVNLHDVEEARVQYHGGSLDTLSPVCGCNVPNPYAWRGVTFVYDDITIGPLQSESGSVTGYFFSSPVPQPIQFSGSSSWRMTISIFETTGVDETEVEQLLLHDVGASETRERVRLAQQRRAGMVTVVASRPIRIGRNSATPVAAWIPIEGSTLTLRQDVEENGRWQIIEEIDFPRPGDAQSVNEEDIPQSIVNMIGTRFLVLLPSDASIVFHNRPLSPLQRPDPSRSFAMVIDVPYSVRLGIHDWTEFDMDAVLRETGERAGDTAMIFHDVPERGRLSAEVNASPETERRAIRALNRDSLVVANGTIDADPARVQMVMRSPPIPRMPGVNIFGSVSSVVFTSATGDIVLGAEPLPPFNAPSEFELRPASADEDAPPIPIIVDATSSTISTAFASVAQLRINGTTVTRAETLLTGIWRDVLNIGSILAALGWLVGEFLLARRRTSRP